jgi:hypothetical protein
MLASSTVPYMSLPWTDTCVRVASARFRAVRALAISARVSSTVEACWSAPSKRAQRNPRKSSVQARNLACSAAEASMRRDAPY